MSGVEDFKREIATPLGRFSYFSLRDTCMGEADPESLPFSIRILLENIVRNQNGTTFTRNHLETILKWKPDPAGNEIPFLPARVLMQDFTGVPSIVDIASLRSEVARNGLDPRIINPKVPVDLIIDHSVQVDYFGTSYSYQRNVELEYSRNNERYSLLKWAQASFDNFNVLPPGMGICHQVNLEYLATVATVRDGFIFPDTLVGTDSHTPMVNGIGVAGWGVGGIEAEAVMLGQPVYINLPQVMGLKLTGRLKAGTTSTDLVLHIAEVLRKAGVVGKFVEVFGQGLDNLTVPDRATISNMSPEFGCTMTYFPPDDKTLEYLRMTGREKKKIAAAEKYLKTNLLWRTNEDRIVFSSVLEVNLGDVVPSIAGPKRPQDKIPLSEVKDKFIDILSSSYKRQYVSPDGRDEGNWSDEGGNAGVYIQGGKGSHALKDAPVISAETEPVIRNGLKSVRLRTGNTEYMLSDGSLVIAAITSCTNTSNPSVMIGAGLLARKAVERGLKPKPWVKTSLAPGSRVVTDYLRKAGLLPYLEALGFNVVGYGCTTCIGNSGPLPAHISKAVTQNELVVGSVLSGNRNFEARIHPLVKMNFLASPLLVVAYSIPGRIDIDLEKEPIGYDPNLEPVYLKDVWPSPGEIDNVMNSVVGSADFIAGYKDIFNGDENWRKLTVPGSDIFKWNDHSSYIREAPFFINLPVDQPGIKAIRSARILLNLGDSVTTDHISPAGSIAEDSPAGRYLKIHGTEKADFNSYGSRRGNHEVMVRGTFANPRLKNLIAGREGGITRVYPEGTEFPVYDASVKYRERNVALVVIAGKEYGSGSSRDWAAKGAALLGVSAIIAESFERIHRSNLVGMGVLPLQFIDGQSDVRLSLKGDEVIDIPELGKLFPGKELKVTATSPDGRVSEFRVIARLDSPIEVVYYLNGGILQYVLRNILHTRKPL